MKKITKFIIKKARPLGKDEYTSYVEEILRKTKKFFPIVSRVYETPQEYRIEAGFDGSLSSREMKSLSNDKKFLSLDVLLPNKIQISWSKI